MSKVPETSTTGRFSSFSRLTRRQSIPDSPSFRASAPLQGLAAEQREKVTQLKQAVQPRIQDSIPLQNFVSTSCLVRYLRARSWVLRDAIKMLDATITWRIQYKPEQITWEDVVDEAGTGKQYILPDPKGNHRGLDYGTDLKGRPVLIMRPRCENTKNYDRQMKFVVRSISKRHLPVFCKTMLLETAGKCLYICICVCARMRVCMRMCVRAFMRALATSCMCESHAYMCV